VDSINKGFQGESPFGSLFHFIQWLNLEAINAMLVAMNQSPKKLAI